MFEQGGGEGLGTPVILCCRARDLLLTSRGVAVLTAQGPQRGIRWATTENTFLRIKTMTYIKMQFYRLKSGLTDLKSFFMDKS